MTEAKRDRFFMLPEYDENHKMVSPELSFQMKFPIKRGERKYNRNEFQTVGLVPQNYRSESTYKNDYVLRDLLYYFVAVSPDPAIKSYGRNTMGELIIGLAYGLVVEATLSKSSDEHWSSQSWSLYEVHSIDRVDNQFFAYYWLNRSFYASDIVDILELKYKVQEYEQPKLLQEAWGKLREAYEISIAGYDHYGSQTWHNIFDLNVR